MVGTSRQRPKDYQQCLEPRTWDRLPDRRHPILIPDTSPTSCFSFGWTLNLRLSDEFLTGDWHFGECFFGYHEPTFASLAGHRSLVDTTAVLDSKGVRDMDRLIDSHNIQPYDWPMWVANPYRALADMVMMQLEGPAYEELLPACQINDWMWTEEDYEILVRDYLRPLRELAHFAGRRGGSQTGGRPSPRNKSFFTTATSGQSSSRASDTTSREYLA